MTEDAIADALNQSIRWLARREYSVYELSQRLIAKHYSSTVIDSVVEKLSSQGLISDQRFVEAWVRSRIQRGYGPMKIRQELKAKGVSDTLINPAVDESNPAWLDRLKDLWQKKYGTMPKDYPSWSKQARGLQSKGFTSEQIHQILPYKDL